MGTREVLQGPVSQRVATNVRRVRQTRDWKQQDLSDALRQIGRPIVMSGVSKIEKGERRVDVDDLVALAWVLGVSPNLLLFADPTETGGRDHREGIALTDSLSPNRQDVMEWAYDAPPPGTEVQAIQQLIAERVEQLVTERLAEREGNAR